MRAARVASLPWLISVLLAGIAASALSASLPLPPSDSRLQREPLPLVEGGRLAGVVWLEGDSTRTLAVRYARWNGAGWEAPQTISPPGPGSQLALCATRLASGAWLLAWSAFDGHDDEILWSWQTLKGDKTGWSAPARVAADNEVPDVTPALTATADGALLAWSRFDAEGGGYQVVTARFRAGRWEAPRAAAPVGSLFPSFEAAPPETGAKESWLLLYQTAAPRAWAAVEVDGAGRTGRTAALKMGSNVARRERPGVTADRSGVTFRWPALGDQPGDPGEQRAADWERP